MTESEQHGRILRSFVRRTGRLTSGQQKALDELLPEFGIPETPVCIDFTRLFGNTNPVTLEIGFGNGESLAEMAANNPDRNYLGIEVHTPGVGHLLSRIQALTLTNIRVFQHDAVEFIQQRLPANSLAEVQIYFPDPWHKKRHNKRRLIQAAFLTLLKPCLQHQAVIHIATDWEPYAEHCEAVFSTDSDFTAHPEFPDKYQRPPHRPETKFERRGLKRQHVISDLLYIYQKGHS